MSNTARQLSRLPLDIGELMRVASAASYAVVHHHYSIRYVFNDDSELEIDRYNKIKVNGKYVN